MGRKDKMDRQSWQTKTKTRVKRTNWDKPNKVRTNCVLKMDKWKNEIGQKMGRKDKMDRNKKQTNKNETQIERTIETKSRNKNETQIERTEQDEPNRTDRQLD